MCLYALPAVRPKPCCTNKAWQHSGFRATWDKIYATGTGGFYSTTPEAFMKMILDWCMSLDQHHRLEEEHVFPKLAVKMRTFRKADVDGTQRSGEVIDEETAATEPTDPGYVHKQHRQIHAGLDILHAYVKTWLAEEKREVDWEEIRGLMDSFGPILWKHMDEEVETLGAANMRLYWDLGEMRELPFKVKD